MPHQPDIELESDTCECACWDVIRDAIDLASDQDQMTWITGDGKRLAAIVPVSDGEEAVHRYAASA